MAANRPLDGHAVLVTGITDESSLAYAIASELRDQGARLVCAGLGPTPHHQGLSERAIRLIETTWQSFQTVAATLGGDVATFPFDATIDATVADLARSLRREGVSLGGFVHAIALDRSIRGGSAKPMLDVTREEFLSCLDVSAYSLLAVTRAFLDEGVLGEGASVVALSYLGASRVPSHPYRNVGVAKAALERLVVELAHELGHARRLRFNAVRFSPWTASRAGGAIPGLAEAMADAAARAPLGNAEPRDLGLEVAHLLRPGGRITGEIRHVDGGYHVLA